ncbi:uncharacterized protein B0I36DRAFT_373587 [Microdochium trichocladiopsis]|uniref:N-acetyltransferase domain-containing protein n=1 Tax=Microdochium trichocladiopsis TaxID=1682393 RepID=A0A9P9BVC3_9PEZI|nr:uncharacterized protein B0I36DRAFT_373587 [Microdochium trichocladiopsis]KAH7033207.1 hypothetical protein B0I36DRAFT_373587 [Microdochium trichocladiopsis]
MDLDPGEGPFSEAQRRVAGSAPFPDPAQPITVIRNNHSNIPLGSILNKGEIILLLTPVVVIRERGETPGRDPFEILGRAVAAKHAGVRHVPYTALNGITNTHAAFIRAARVVIFVVSGPPRLGQVDQVELGRAVQRLARGKPFIMITTLSASPVDDDFPTALQVTEMNQRNLQTLAESLFVRELHTKSLASEGSLPAHGRPETNWSIEVWDTLKDMGAVSALWNECLPSQFKMDANKLRSVLARGDDAFYHVVCMPQTSLVIGLCTTYTVQATRQSDELIGYLATLIVDPRYRGQGIGRALHDHALSWLRRMVGLSHIQLGSSFPRLLRGLPTSVDSEHWFVKRGWDIGMPGNEIRDLLLETDAWPSAMPEDIEIRRSYRQATPDDLSSLRELLERSLVMPQHAGWLEQYTAAIDTGRLDNIIVGMHGRTIVATALIYQPNDDSTLERNLPWAGAIGTDVGGITCVYIADVQAGSLQIQRDSIMIRLLDTCVAIHQRRGMARVFLDGVRGGFDAYQALGMWSRGHWRRNEIDHYS